MNLDKDLTHALLLLTEDAVRSTLLKVTCHYEGKRGRGQIERLARRMLLSLGESINRLRLPHVSIITRKAHAVEEMEYL